MGWYIYYSFAELGWVWPEHVWTYVWDQLKSLKT